MDRISKLPDDVLCHILSFLPTKHAVATSILSSRWGNLWSFLTIIDLYDSPCGNPSMLFINFLDRVLSMNQSQTIVKFRLSMSHDYGLKLSGFNGIIQNVFSRNVVEFEIGIFADTFMDDDCLKIPHSQSLKVLKVRTRYRLKMAAFPGCFPSLRVFEATVCLDKGDEWITNLFLCLPALEKLCLVADLDEWAGKIYVNIGGAALKHLELELFMFNYEYDECDAVVIIDAPKLDYLRLKDRCLASYVVKNKHAISEVRLAVGNYHEEFLEFLDGLDPTRRVRFTELLQGLVNSTFISASATTVKAVLSQRWNIPVLPSLTKLELKVHASSWIGLIHWLESCPNLKVLSLIIKGKPVQDFEEVLPDVVPSCLSLCVKEIEIKSKRHRKYDHEKILNYLLNNAKVLDKFTVDTHGYIRDGIVQ